MKFSVSAAALISLIPTVLGLTINTPTNVVQCQPILLTWSDGTAPFYLSLIPPGQVSATPLYTFPTQQGTSLTWIVNLEANTNFNIALKDNTGATAYSDIVTVQASNDRSCVGNSTSVSSGPDSSSNTNSGSNTNTNTGSGGAGSPTRTVTTSTPTGSGSGSSGGAVGLAFSSFGVAGVIGAVAALF